MKYYAVFDSKTGILLAEGTARECRKMLGCSSIDTFYNLVSRSERGINKRYKVVIKNGGDTNYPVIGNEPFLSEETDSRTQDGIDLSLRYRFVTTKK